MVIALAYSTQVAANGHFQFGNPPSDPAALRFWNMRALPATQAIGGPTSALVTQWRQVIEPRMATAVNTGAAP